LLFQGTSLVLCFGSFLQRAGLVCGDRDPLGFLFTLDQRFTHRMFLLDALRLGPPLSFQLCNPGLGLLFLRDALFFHGKLLLVCGDLALLTLLRGFGVELGRVIRRVGLLLVQFAFVFQRIVANDRPGGALRLADEAIDEAATSTFGFGHGSPWMGV
jgi:hypothetical protein